MIHCSNILTRLCYLEKQNDTKKIPTNLFECHFFNLVIINYEYMTCVELFIDYTMKDGQTLQLNTQLYNICTKSDD